MLYNTSAGLEQTGRQGEEKLIVDELIPSLPAADWCGYGAEKIHGTVLQLGSLVLDVNDTPTADIIQASRKGEVDAVRSAFQNDPETKLLTLNLAEPRCLLDVVQSTCFYVRLQRKDAQGNTHTESAAAHYEHGSDADDY